MFSIKQFILCLTICAALPMVWVVNAHAQARMDFVTGASSVTAYSHSRVLSPVTDPPCPPIEDLTDSQNSFWTLPTGRIYGGAFTYLKRGVPDCKISAQGTANVLVDGHGTNVVYARWWCHSNTQYDCHDPDCGWSATDSSSFNSTMKLALDGLPPGTPVQVTYLWKHFSSFANEPEAGGEDEAAVAGSSLDLFGQIGFGAGMDIGGVAKFAQKRTGADAVTLNMQIGDTLEINVAGMTHANIDPPAKPLPNPREDDASSDFFGYCLIYINGPNSPVVSAIDTCSDESILYSVDIGSDMEFSDPTPDGTEMLDPGDVYDAASASPIPFLDDLTIFGSDPDPSAVNPAGTCFPGPLQSSQHVLNFDVDGIDRIDYDLFNQAGTYGPGLPSIDQFVSSCIHQPLYAMVSFDEDRGINFNSAVNCNVPSAFDPSDSTFVRGTVDNHDEVMVTQLYPAGSIANYTGVAMPYKNEEAFSVLLAPASPTRYPADLNDDVDALDLVSDLASCGMHYFTVDHEAQYTYGPDTLDPGAVYQVTAPGSIEMVIDPTLHLGILPGVDLDAIEFTWLYDFANLRYGLALAFSVSDSDPFSLTDYTGGLDPDFIYASFLDGSHFQMVGGLAPSNIDALAFSCEAAIAQGSQYVNPSILVGGLATTDPSALALTAFPNPSNGSFDLQFDSPAAQLADLRLFGTNGQLVWSRSSISLSKGGQRIHVPVQHLESGVYLVELEMKDADGGVVRTRVSLMR